MKRELQRRFGALILLSMAALTAKAQDDAPPKPPVRGPRLIIETTQEQDLQPPPDLNPDHTSLTGAQEITLGSPELRHSYWVPGFRIQNNFGSDDPNKINSGWYSATYFLGDFSLRESWSHSELNVNYTGGGSVSASSDFSGNGYQQVGISQTLQWKRWQFRFLDQFSRLPESPFGLGGVGRISTAGVGGTLGEGLPGLQTNYVPNQSIFTATGPRLTNGFVVQGEYFFTARSSVTAVASIGILHFTQGNSIDTEDGIFSLGYNYQVTRRDTLGVLYRFTGFRYPGNPQALNDHAAQLAYGRRITGRLALQLFAGPDVTTFRQPSGASQTSVSAGASLKYALRHTELWLTYNRGLSGGSGILTGSTTDQIQAQLSHQILRQWQATAGFGYARNHETMGILTSSTSRNLNSVFASGGLNRALGRTTNFSVNYTFQHQNNPLCGVASCGSSYTQHQIWLGLEWRARPFVLR
jgi:hypothetical protein